MPRHAAVLLVAFAAWSWPAPARSQGLPDTRPWADRGDPASAMVEGLHRFADRETAAGVGLRRARWAIDATSPESYARSVGPNRERFARIIGAVGPRSSPVELAYVSAPDSPAKVAQGGGLAIFAVRWRVYPGVEAEGLLLEPSGEIRADVVAIPDGSSSPEAFAGIATGAGAGSGMAVDLARQGCRVLVPTLLDRTDEFSGNPKVRMTNLSHREWIYRMAYEAGRHPIGYEVDEVRAAVDWFRRTGPPGRPIGVAGHGEGGLIALYAAAVDPRVDGAWVAGYFGPREQVWREPIDRNVWGLLAEFGDAEIAGLIAPRALVVEACGAPEFAGPLPPRGGRADAASGSIKSPAIEDVRREFARVATLVPGSGPGADGHRDEPGRGARGRARPFPGEAGDRGQGGRGCPGPPRPPPVVRPPGPDGAAGRATGRVHAGVDPDLGAAPLRLLVAGRRLVPRGLGEVDPAAPRGVRGRADRQALRGPGAD